MEPTLDQVAACGQLFAIMIPAHTETIRLCLTIGESIHFKIVSRFILRAGHRVEKPLLLHLWTKNGGLLAGLEFRQSI